MVRTSVIVASCCLALLRGEGCFEKDGPCEYEDTLLDEDFVTAPGMTLGEEVEALAGSYAGTWRWHASTAELTIEGGGIEFPATATFVPVTLRQREHVGTATTCLDTGIKVDGLLVFTDSQGETIVSMDITADRGEGDLPRYVASREFSPISDFSDRLWANVEYDLESVVGRIHFLDEDHLAAEFDFGGQTRLGQTGSGSQIVEGVILDVAEFE